MLPHDQMDLVYSLVGFPESTEWICFRSQDDNLDSLAADISGLANSAALLGKDEAFIVWGLQEGTHRPIGTAFEPTQASTSFGRELLPWLDRTLSPNVEFRFANIHAQAEPDDESPATRFVVARIHPARLQPITAEGIAYIREGNRTVVLDEHSPAAQRLAARLHGGDFEDQVAASNVSRRSLAGLLDLDAFFAAMHREPPAHMVAAVEEACAHGFAIRQANDRFSITNLGAVLLARNLGDFPHLDMRPIRVARYAGTGRFDLLGETAFDAGYALSLPQAEEHILALVKDSPVPRKAIHELLVNAVVHQDLASRTSGPRICVFDDRIEFSNPGESLVPAKRLLNSTPEYRNPKLAALVRRMNLSGEGGMGWGLAVASCEGSALAAPTIETGPTGTNAVLHLELPYPAMSRQQRKQAVYWHACLLMEEGRSMGNASLRARFGMEETPGQVVAASRLIRECVADGLLKPADPDSGTKQRTYLPAWA